MKIAIIGSHNNASYVCDFLKNIEADVSWFPADHNIKRVHKRFLSPKESLGLSRIHDLFRVVFEEDPLNTVSEQMLGSNEEIFQKLSEMEVEYLKSRYESFKDFDVIINMPSDKDYPIMAGPSQSLSIGEETLKSYINYNPHRFDLTEFKDIAVVGENKISPREISRLVDWLIEGEGYKRVFLITSGIDPLSAPEYLTPLLKLQDFENKRVETFLETLRKWQTLEDYEKVKISKPEEPIPTLVYFTGHEVTVMTKLSDQDKVYLTCEIPAFRKPTKGIENSLQSLKTIAVDHIYVCKGSVYQDNRFSGLLTPVSCEAHLSDSFYEPGFIQLGVNNSGEFVYSTPEKQIEFIEKALNVYFRREDT